MYLQRIALVVLSIATATAATPLPELRIEPTGGGSILHVKNVTAQPLTAFLIELVNYPGSSFSYWNDELGGGAIAPGVEKDISIQNMTVGAVPDYVKMQAAIYADGTTAGSEEKVAQLVERRRQRLQTTRELIRRLAAASSKATAVADLKQWAESVPNKGAQAYTRMLITSTAGNVERQSIDDVLERLRATEKVLAESKPEL